MFIRYGGFYMHMAKYMIAGILILSAVILLPGCLGSGAIQEFSLTPGIYEGTGQGFRGPIHVQVEVSPAGIEGITIAEHSEGTSGSAAMEELLESVLEYGTTELDAISGATFSSMGFLEAVDDALGKAHK